MSASSAGALRERPQPSPQLFFETANAYQRTAALRAAVDLDLFTAIGEGYTVPSAIARQIGADERGVRVLCDYLVIAGFLTKEAGAYALTPDTATFLDRRSAAYVGTALRFLNSPELTGAFADLAAVVRKGGTVISERGTLAPEDPIWIEFARDMAPLMRMPADWIAGVAAEDARPRMKVLDIAAGHGIYGITIARRFTDARIVALDWPNVLAVAQENARAEGVADRYSTLPGSAFEVDYGRDYDLVLITNFLHHFDPPTCVTLLKRLRAAMKPSARAITLEFVPNEDRVSPPATAAFSLMMLGTTPSGDAYTFAEYDRMFREAGFRSSEMLAREGIPQQLIVSRA